MEDIKKLLNITETDILVSARYFCPLINAYFPGANKLRDKIQCPLSKECQHPRC